MNVKIEIYGLVLFGIIIDFSAFFSPSHSTLLIGIGSPIITGSIVGYFVSSVSVEKGLQIEEMRDARNEHLREFKELFNFLKNDNKPITIPPDFGKSTIGNWIIQSLYYKPTFCYLIERVSGTSDKYEVLLWDLEAHWKPEADKLNEICNEAEGNERWLSEIMGRYRDGIKKAAKEISYNLRTITLEPEVLKLFFDIEGEGHLLGEIKLEIEENSFDEIERLMPISLDNFLKAKMNLTKKYSIPEIQEILSPSSIYSFIKDSWKYYGLGEVSEKVSDPLFLAIYEWYEHLRNYIGNAENEYLLYKALKPPLIEKLRDSDGLILKIADLFTSTLLGNISGSLLEISVTATSEKFREIKRSEDQMKLTLQLASMAKFLPGECMITEKRLNGY